MERTLKITLDTARRLYAEGGENRELALSVFNEEEINPTIPDKAWVWCYDRSDTIIRRLTVYDAINQAVFYDDGARNGSNWDNYELYTGEKMQWMIEAEKILED